MTDHPTPQPSGRTASIKITIPDGPPEQQLQHIEHFISVLRTFATVTGEDIEADLQPLRDAITKIEAAAPQPEKGDK